MNRITPLSALKSYRIASRKSHGMNDFEPSDKGDEKNVICFAGPWVATRRKFVFSSSAYPSSFKADVILLPVSFVRSSKLETTRPLFVVISTVFEVENDIIRFVLSRSFQQCRNIATCFVWNINTCLALKSITPKTRKLSRETPSATRVAERMLQ